MRPHELLDRPPGRGKRGAALSLDLLIYIIFLSLLGGVVVSGVKLMVEQQTVGANQLQQKSSVLQAMNRTSSDINTSKPIVFATKTELVTENELEVAGQPAKTVQIRYSLGRAPGAPSSAPLNTLYSQQRDVTPGQRYDTTTAAISAAWGTPSATQAVVRNLKTPVNEVFRYYDRSGNQLTGSLYANGDAEVIARVDTVITANLDKSGFIQLASSAVPRAALPFDQTSNLNPLVCPPASASRSDDGTKAVIRWSSVPGANYYEVWRDGTKLTNPAIAAVPGQDDYFFQEPLLQDGVPHQYVVYSGSASHGISIGCNPLNITSEIPATMLVGEMIPPTSGSNPWTSTDWDNPSQQTTMRLSWNSVVGATQYILYRQPVNDNGTLGTKIETAVLGPDDDLVYDYAAEWDKKWSWSVTVYSRAGGSKDSNSIALRGYPAPVPLTLSASSYSVNTVDWTAYAPDANVDSFSVYRSKDGQPNGTYDLLATYNRGTSQFTSERYIDNGSGHNFGKPALGSTHTYVVIAHNESGYSNKVKVAQLQFPPDPVLVAVGPNGTRDNDVNGVRTNTIKWNVAKSATGYHVERHTANSEDCLTGTCATNKGGVQGGNASSFTDSSSAVAASTRFSYVAYAYNATGVSPGLAADVSVIQRPAPPTLNSPATADRPSLNSTNTTTRFTRNAGSWCTNDGVAVGGSGCAYEVTNFNNSRGQLGSARTNASSDWVTFGNQDWGRHYYYKARSQNGAVTSNGYSDYSNEVAADTYPGPFSVVGAQGSAGTWSSGDKRGTAHYWDIVYDSVDYGRQYIPGCNGDKSRDCGPSRARVAVSWGNAPGAANIEVSRQHIGGSATLIGTHGNGSSGITDADASPGVTYRWDLKAKSLENNLTRTVSSANINTLPDVPRASEIMTTCITNGPSQYFKIVQTRFNQAPVRGNWSSGTTMGVWAPTRANNDDGTRYGGNVNATYGPGQGYGPLTSTSFGIPDAPWALGGFQNYSTWNGVGSSMVHENAITQVARPFGCGALHSGDQGNYIEPSGACYGYRPGTTSCAPTIPQNRPQYFTR